MQDAVVEWAARRFDCYKGNALPWQGLQPPALPVPSRHLNDSKFFRDVKGAPYQYVLRGGAGPLFSYNKEDMIEGVGLLVTRRASKMKTKCDEHLRALVQAEESKEKEDGASLDWSAIAADLSAFSKEHHSPSECFSYYYNALDPSINWGRWTAAEEKKLVELATLHAEHDWIVIADKLQSNRTPLQCLKHYQQSFNNKLTTVSEWTLDEEQQLKQAVETHGRVDWESVARDVPGRTAKQCLYKWRRSSGVYGNDVVNGQWLEEEERRLFLGAVAYEIPHLDQFKKTQAEIDAVLRGGAEIASSTGEAGGREGEGEEVGEKSDDEEGAAAAAVAEAAAVAPGSKKVPPKRKYLKAPKPADAGAHYVPVWVKVAEVVPGRDDTRCRDKWTCHLDPSVKSDAWSGAEDKLLLALVDKIGAGNWAEIAQYLHGRMDSDTMLRWYTLSGADKKREHKSASKKRKAIVPPAFRRSDAGAALSGDDFVSVLQVDV